MYCHKCGTGNDGGSLYCHACGENLSPEDISLLDRTSASPAGTLVPVPEPRDTPTADLSPPILPPVAVPSQVERNPMKFSTRVAYNILESDRKTVALLIILLTVLVAGLLAVTSCLGLVSSFAALSDANRALPSGIQSEVLQNSIDAAWRSIWGHLAAIPISLLVFFLALRLLVRVKRVADTLKAVRKEFD